MWTAARKSDPANGRYRIKSGAVYFQPKLATGSADPANWYSGLKTRVRGNVSVCLEFSADASNFTRVLPAFPEVGRAVRNADRQVYLSRRVHSRNALKLACFSGKAATCSRPENCVVFADGHCEDIVSFTNPLEFNFNPVLKRKSGAL